MKVYSLYNNKKGLTPFYIGITNYPNQRLMEHKNNLKNHKPYVNNKNDIQMKIICDLGNNEYSKIVAERIEVNLIKYYNTVNYGSNKVYDIKKFTKNYFKSMWNNKNYSKTMKTLFNEQMKEKRNKTIESKKHKKFNKIIKLIKEDPSMYTIDELIKKSGFKSYTALNNYTLKYHKIKFDKWLLNYKQHWNNQWKHNSVKT